MQRREVVRRFRRMVRVDGLLQREVASRLGHARSERAMRFAREMVGGGRREPKFIQRRSTRTRQQGNRVRSADLFRILTI